MLSKALPGSKLYEPSAAIVNVPPLLPAIALPGPTEVVPFETPVTASGSCSTSVSLVSTPWAASAETTTRGLVAFASTCATGASFWPWMTIVAVAVANPPWPSLT